MRKASSKVHQDKEKAGIKTQPPLLAILHVAVAMVLTNVFPLPLVVPATSRAIGFPLVILGFLLGIGAMIAFRRTRAMAKAHDPAARLVRSGIYRFTRNPVYLGFLLMLLGLPLDVGSYWGILLAPLMVFLFNRFIIEPEELSLLQKFGDEYQNYKSKVRRWV